MNCLISRTRNGRSVSAPVGLLTESSAKRMLAAGEISIADYRKVVLYGSKQQQAEPLLVAGVVMYK